MSYGYFFIFFLKKEEHWMKFFQTNFRELSLQCGMKMALGWHCEGGAAIRHQRDFCACLGSYEVTLVVRYGVSRNDNSPLHSQIAAVAEAPSQ